MSSLAAAATFSSAAATCSARRSFAYVSPSLSAFRKCVATRLGEIFLMEWEPTILTTTCLPSPLYSVKTARLHELSDLKTSTASPTWYIVGRPASQRGCVSRIATATVRLDTHDGN